MTHAVPGESKARGPRRRDAAVPDLAVGAVFFALVWLVNAVAAILSLWAFQELGIVTPLEAPNSPWAD